MDVVGGLAVVCREKGTRLLAGTASLPGPLAPALAPSVVGSPARGTLPPPQGLPLTFKVFLPIASAGLFPSSRPCLLKDLLEPLHTEGPVKFVFLLLREARGHWAQALWLWL